MKKTLVLLRQDKRSTLEIYAETDLPFYWLRKLRAGDFLNPSVNRLQYLYEFLSKNKLSV